MGPLLPLPLLILIILIKEGDLFEAEDLFDLIAYTLLGFRRQSDEISPLRRLVVSDLF